DCKAFDSLCDSSKMTHGFDDISGARFTLRANHCRAFADAPKRLAEIARSAHHRDLELMFVDVMLFVGRRQHFAFVDEVDSEGLQNLRLSEVADAHLSHYRNCDFSHDLANLFGR